MKKPFKIFKLSAILALLFAFYSCQHEEIVEENHTKSYELKTNRVSINQVLNEIESKEIKQKLQDKIFNTSINNALLRSSDSIPYFIKKEKDDELTTYILNINSYSQFTPYFLKFIITKNKDETERIGFLKYIPDNQTSVLDLATFTGECQILDINFELTATSNYIDGIKQDSTQNNTSNRVTCTGQIIITEVKCSHSGVHGVGETCEGGLVNDAHYLVSIFRSCTGRPGDLVQIIEDTNPENSGGGTFSASIFLNPFLQTLTEDQLLVYHSNPSIQTYLVNNLIVEQIPNYNPLLGGSPTRVVIKPEAEEFVLELIQALNEIDSDIDDQSILQDITKITIYAYENNYFNQPLDDVYFSSNYDFSSLDFNDPTIAINFARMFIAHCAVLREEHPNWSTIGIFLQASLDTTQLLLDFAGVVPVIGEVADIANGTIYLIQGDGVNASLSYASAIPVAGWFSAGVKFAKRADGLKLLVKANGIIDFGKRADLRKILNITDPSKQAHHIMPWAFRESNLVQKAAKSSNAFHMNQFSNGFPLPTSNHLTGHNLYSNKIQSILQANSAQIENMSPTQAYNFLTGLNSHIKGLLQANQNMNLGQISNLISYP